MTNYLNSYHPFKCPLEGIDKTGHARFIQEQDLGACEKIKCKCPINNAPRGYKLACVSMRSERASSFNATKGFMSQCGDYLDENSEIFTEDLIDGLNKDGEMHI
ncbi:MAG: hypothetical protein FWC00_03530 [Firmicutes bacterium]|nr:hypothetical protein [Bacillota bacterium]